jgi:predicted nucleic acid-binding protein
MKARPSHVVIDADVARAAGLSENPVSASARKLLMGIKDSSINVAFCPVLMAEWKKHKSGFSAKWLASMIAKKKFHLTTPPALMSIEIDKSTISDIQKKIGQKDAHVVDIAAATGNFIASNDKIARAVFCTIAQASPVLHKIMWAVPADAEPDIEILFGSDGYLPGEWRLLKEM